MQRNQSSKTGISWFSFGDLFKVAVFAFIVAISLVFKSVIISFVLLALLVFFERRLIMPVILITPVIETILIPAEGLTITKLLAAFFAVYFIVSLFIKKGSRVDKNTIWLLSFLLIAVLGMIIGFSEIPSHEVFDAIRFNLVTVLPKIIIAILIYHYYKANGVAFLKDSLMLSTPALSISLAIIVLYFIFWGSTELAWGMQIIRLTFEGSDPNEFSGMLAALGAFPLFLAFFKTNKLYRFIGFISVGFILYAITITLSRGGFLTFVFLFLLFIGVFFRDSFKRLMLFAVFATIGIGALIHFEIIYFQAVQERFMGKQIRDIQYLTAGRIDFFNAAIDEALKKPILGYGNFPGTAQMVTTRQLGMGGSIHNIFLELWIRLGLLGVLAFLIIILRASKGIQLAFQLRIKDKSNIILTVPIISMLVIIFAGLGLSWEWRDILWYLIGISLSSSLLLQSKV